MKKLMRWLAFVMGAALASASGGSFAIELEFKPPAPDAPPKRRLIADPAAPAGAPSSLLIEVSEIQESPQTALQLARKAMDASRQAYGDRDPRLITPLTNLGNAKQRAGQSDQSLKDFRTAIKLAEADGGSRDLRLFEAWYGLGVAHFSADRPTSAAEAFETALHAHRVNEGLYTHEQLDVLEALALSFEKAGLPERAKQWQKRRVQVAVRTVSHQEPEAAASTLMSVGRWLRAQGEANAAIPLHHQAVELVSKAYGTEAPQLIGPLVELAVSVRLRKAEYGEASAFRNLLPVSILSDARRIVENQPDITPAERAGKLMRLGDLYWLIGQTVQAKRTYRTALELRDDETKTSPLENPVFLVFRPPQPSARAREIGGYVLAEFTVSARGTARNTRIVEATHPWLLQTLGPKLIKALRSARLRPRIVDGRPVRTRDVRYRMRLNPEASAVLAALKPAGLRPASGKSSKRDADSGGVARAAMNAVSREPGAAPEASSALPGSGASSP